MIGKWCENDTVVSKPQVVVVMMVGGFEVDA